LDILCWIFSRGRAGSGEEGGTVLTAEELKTIAERAAGATPGPWEWEGNEELIGSDGQKFVLDAWYSFDTEHCYMDVLDGDKEFIQHARTDIPALLAHIAELETDAANWRKIEAMPMNFRLAHKPVFEFPGDDDWDTKRHYEWAVLYHSTLTSHGATPQEALDRAMKNPQRWVPDYVLTMWREAYLAALEAARKEEE
jgi:hypothetical protein